MSPDTKDTRGTRGHQRTSQKQQLTPRRPGALLLLRSPKHITDAHNTCRQMDIRKMCDQAYYFVTHTPSIKPFIPQHEILIAIYASTLRDMYTMYSD